MSVKVLMTLCARVPMGVPTCRSRALTAYHYIHGPQLLTQRQAATKAEIQDNIKQFKEGNYETLPDPDKLSHFRISDGEKKGGPSMVSEKLPLGTHALPHPIWSEKELLNVKITHKEPECLSDRMAFRSVKLLRGGFDLFSGFSFGQKNERKWLMRICFLETVAGVPGMVAAMTRHLHSLRRLQRDYGWIHTLLEEAENERMHLMTAMQLKKPSLAFRWAVMFSQGVFVTIFSASYLVSPKFCHRFVGYLEEEAVKTYTKCLEDIDNGPMEVWRTQPAPEVAVRYWQLAPESTMRDVILAIRADEAHHRIVNHTLASMKEDDYNPYKPGQ